MSTYLLEIGTEELPAQHISACQERLRDLMAQKLKEASLPFEHITPLSTPRRLALIVKGLAAKQETVTKKIKGPPYLSSFDADGKPKPQAAGFAAKHGLGVDDLTKEEQNGTMYLVANITIAGKSADIALREIVPQVIGQLSGERLMRWGKGDFKFVRPMRWLVSLLDNKIVEFSINDLTAGNASFGHRVLSAGKINISGAETYIEDLRKACVLVDPQERKKIIENQVTTLAQTLTGRQKQLESDLLDEVVNITEWPKAVSGNFEKEYLDLPGALIETIMVHHQKYFPVEKQEDNNGKQDVNLRQNKLLPHFITIVNNDRKEAQPIIKQGNERVLRARLADGRFFYFDDQKMKLTDRSAALAQLTFQEGLGSYADKVERLVQAGRKLSQTLSLDNYLSSSLERTLTLCKLDLVTNLVRELPELQGYVGAWYAESEGETEDVAQAIASHYAPRGTDDDQTVGTVGGLVSILDKTDTLVSLFALGKKPTGGGDPYALRRQAYGLVDMAMLKLSEYPINLTTLIKDFIAACRLSANREQGKFSGEKTQQELSEFLVARVRSNLSLVTTRKEVIDAVLLNRDPLANLADVIIRCRCLENLTEDESGIAMIKAGVRIGNILKPDSPEKVDEALFEEEAERQLWHLFVEQFVRQKQDLPDQQKPWSQSDYEKLLERLKILSESVENFFTAVMVNDDQKAKRDNRHGLLKQINKYFAAIADFSKLQPFIGTSSSIKEIARK